MTMTMARTVRLAALLSAGALAPAVALAAPVLREAEVQITFTSPTSCEVVIALTVDGAAQVEHRLDAEDAELIGMRGATQLSAVRAIGRTQSLVLTPTGGAYQFQYRVRVPDTFAYRCPIWLPTVPTDGQSKAVRIRVELPATASPGSSLPAFNWTGTKGAAVLGHLPAFVRVPYATGGEARPWDIGALMDAATGIVFVGASVIWIWRRKR